MSFPCIRKLECIVQTLFDKNEPNKDLSYFNPSIAYPYLYIRATRKEEFVETNHIFIYNFLTDRICEIEVPYHKLMPTCAVYRGIEDMRLIQYQHRVWFIASSTHANSSMLSEMLIGYFNPDVTQIECMQHIDFGIRPIKNLCPFVHQDRLYVMDVYTLNIYEIVTEESTGWYVPRLLKTFKPCHGMDYHRMRGSTSPIHLHGNLWGCVIHEHIQKAECNGSYAYLSYWMEFDLDCGLVTFVSTPFYIMHWGVEFVSGIQYVRERDQIELYFGIKDKIAVIAYTDLYNLRYGCHQDDETC